MTCRRMSTRLADEPFRTASSSSAIIEWAGCCTGQPVRCFNFQLHNADRRITPALKRNWVELQRIAAKIGGGCLPCVRAACRCKKHPDHCAVCIRALLYQSCCVAILPFPAINDIAISFASSFGTPIRLLSSPNHQAKNSNRKLSNKKPSSLARIRGKKSHECARLRIFSRRASSKALPVAIGLSGLIVVAATVSKTWCPRLGVQDLVSKAGALRSFPLDHRRHHQQGRYHP